MLHPHKTRAAMLVRAQAQVHTPPMHPSRTQAGGSRRCRVRAAALLLPVRLHSCARQVRLNALDLTGARVEEGGCSKWPPAPACPTPSCSHAWPAMAPRQCPPPERAACAGFTAIDNLQNPCMHPCSFEKALAFVLANRLADTTLLPTQLFEIFVDVSAALCGPFPRRGLPGCTYAPCLCQHGVAQLPACPALRSSV